jgi:PhoH-like ATPase
MKKIFVVDTSVFLFDHQAIRNFKEHDVVVPITVIEELDKFKKGNETKNFEARNFMRFIDALTQKKELNQWIKIPGRGNGKLRIGWVKDKETLKNLPFVEMINDHLILGVALETFHENPSKKVVLVSKDLNLRIKARAIGMDAEDYNTGKIENVDDLFLGIIEKKITSKSIFEEGIRNGFFPSEIFPGIEKVPNQYFILQYNRSRKIFKYNEFEDRFFHVSDSYCYGIRPRNEEQAAAMDALMDPTIKCLSLQGSPGTGKTLLALAAALEQRRNYKQIYLARPIVPLNNKDIGFLPGDIKSKINPYMEPLWDNLKVIQNQFNEKDKEFQRIQEMIDKEKLMITPLAFIRGRSLSNVFFIIDESQNLTPLEIKTIVTRAGEGTKIVFTGDIRQIDTPYLDEHSNGLSVLIDKMKGSDLYAHVTLKQGVRSELANVASERL